MQGKWPYCVISYITIRIQLELRQGRIAVYTPPLSQLGPESYGHIELWLVVWGKWEQCMLLFKNKLAKLKSRVHFTSGIDKSLALERKIESRKRNFSLDLENLIVPISLSTLDFREWQETILFLLSIFESGKNKFSFHSRFSRVARQISLSTLVFFSIFESSNREFNIIYSRWFKIDQPISVPEV